MAKQLDNINSSQQEFIKKQKIFFVGTAAAEGRIKVDTALEDPFLFWKGFSMMVSSKP
jgi:hypothetical protein